MKVQAGWLQTLSSVGLILTIVFSSGSRANTVDYAPDEAIAGTGGVCVERFEDNGALNTWPLDVSFGNQVEVILGGGRAACVFMLPGTYHVTIEWTDSHGKKRSGGAEVVKVSGGRFVPLLICNTLTGPADNREWASGWVIRQQSKMAVDRCS